MPENLFPQSDNSRALARPTRLSAGFMAAAAAVLIASLFVISRFNYLLFHTLTEFFAIAVAWALFLLLWNGRRLIRQQALVFLGIAYLNIGLLDLLHTLSFKGMGVLAGPDTVNQSTQLWIAARGMEAVSLLVFTLLLNRRRIRAELVLGLYLCVSALILAAIFAWPVFPDCFIEGSGLTTFKVAGEYVICLILAAAAVFLFRRRHRLEKAAFGLVLAAIGLTILAELAFTLYTDVYGLSNMAGHFFKLASFFCIYLGLIRMGLIRPYAMLFQDLAREKEALARSEEKFSKVFHQAPVMMALSTFEEGRYLDVNQSFEQSLGYSREQVAGRQSIELGILEAEDRQRSLQAIREGGEARELEVKLYRPDRTAIDCLYSMVPVDVDGQTHLLSIASDISRLKQAEAGREALEGQLQQAQKMEAVGTLAGGIAHDFNNILASILGYTELAREDVPAGSWLQQNLDEVLIAGNRARHLVDQILAISRQEKQEKTALDIVPLVKEALKMLRSAIPSSIEMREAICREALVVEADPTQIHQVVVNLATNARQAMPGQKGVLEVAVAAAYLAESANERFPDLVPGRYARISVSDNGCGIAPADLEKIFEPYFTTKKKGQGTGLGLSVVHGIIRGHKGDIRVNSRLGQGTTFQVYLPLSGREQACEPAAPEPQELPGGTEAILVVDDEVPVARMVAMHLQALGYRVSVQTESAAALKIFQSAPDNYDMVITDMTMPGMTGDQLALAVKELRPALPVVLCTGFSEAIDADGASALGIGELLMKPVDKAALAHVVRKLLDEQPGAGSGY